MQQSVHPAVVLGSVEKNDLSKWRDFEDDAEAGRRIACWCDGEEDRHWPAGVFGVIKAQVGGLEESELAQPYESGSFQQQ